MPSIKELQQMAAPNARENEARKNLVQLMDCQNRNLFEVIFYPNSFSTNPMSIIKSVTNTVQDALIARLHIQTLTISTFNALEFEGADIMQYVKGLVRGTEVTMSFLETEQAVVRNFIKSWTDMIYFYDKTTQMYKFRDDQLSAKKNAKIFLLNGLGNNTPVYLTIVGMRPKSLGELTLDQAEVEPYKPEITFHCDRIDWTGLNSF